MKKIYNAPKLSVHGSIEGLTQQSTTKKFGTDDGFQVSIPVPGGTTNVPIGS